MIIRATTPQHFARAQGLLQQQRAWLEGLWDGDLAVPSVQPSAAVEYEEPARVYGRPGACLLLALANWSPVGIAGVACARPGVAELKRMYVRPRAAFVSSATRRRGATASWR